MLFGELTSTREEKIDTAKREEGNIFLNRLSPIVSFCQKNSDAECPTIMDIAQNKFHKLSKHADGEKRDESSDDRNKKFWRILLTHLKKIF